MDTNDYITTHADRFKEQLKDLLRIPSVSTLAQHKPDVERAAAWLVEDMRRIGFQMAEAIPTAGHPIVYGEWVGAGQGAPTVLVYGHYDVQPAEMADGWLTEPFQPVERDGKIYARGAIDSKSNVMAQLKAAEAMLATGGAPVNLKLLFEGEEESNSENLSAFIAANRDRLKADVVVICDGSMADRQQPDMSYGLRGVVSMELEVFGPRQDLHSGHFGGTVHNPIQALAEIITGLHNPDGSVSVPGFYEDVEPLSDEERAELSKALPWVEAEWRDVAAAPAQWGEPAYNLHERIGARPTLEINGIAGGFAAEGFKTVLPGRALAKISCRLVPHQTSQKTYERVRDYVMQIAPPTVRVEMRLISIGEPLLIDRHSPAVQAALRAYENTWGKRPHFTRAGGSVPVAVDLQRELGAPLVLLAFGYKGCGAHGPNEHVYLDMWYRGMATMIAFCREIAG
ncbi:dipeptidase [Anaerolineae bacterium CFX8]|nr:dipeptidase [Anaerolineae bacterium CFX8]